MSELSQKAKLVVEREKSAKGSASATIYVDEVKIGEVKANEKKEFLVESGPIRLHARLLTLTSDSVEIDLRPGDVAELLLRQKVGDFGVAVYSWEVTKAPDSTYSLHTSIDHTADLNVPSIEKRLATLDRARQEVETISKQSRDANTNILMIGTVILLLTGIVVFFAGLSNESELAFVLGLVISLAGVGLFYVMWVQKSIASKSYDEARVRLRKIEDETFELRKKLENITLKVDSSSAHSFQPSTQSSSMTNTNVSKTNQLEIEMKKAKQMFDDELITQEEFQALRKKLLESL